MATTWTLDTIEQAIRRAWGDDTCDPDDRVNRSPANPARGQCGVTALVLHDLVGGDLICGEAYVGPRRVGVHYWNRLPSGLELDLTREQFGPDESVVGGEVVVRPTGPPRRCREQYELLRARVFEALGLDVI